jgi:hypothetical protein
MLIKGRTLALGVVVAGAIGFGAPMANAATLPGGGAVTSATSFLGSLGCTKVLSGSTIGGGSAVVGGLSGATSTPASAQAIVKGLLGGAEASVIPAGTTCGKVVAQLKTVCAEFKSADPLTAAASLAASKGLSVAQLQSLCAGTLPTNVVPANVVPTNLGSAPSLPSVPGVNTLTDEFDLLGGLGGLSAIG